MVQQTLRISTDREASKIKDVTAEANAYAAGNGGPPPEDVYSPDFSVHLDSLDCGKHAWNVAARLLLVKEFRKRYPDSKVDDMYLEEQFNHRLSRLAKCK